MNAKLSCLFVVVFFVAFSLQCNKEGYEEYLVRYPFKNVDGYEDLHVSTYVSNCKKLQYKQSRGEPAEETALLDWKDDELAALGELSVRYSGVASLYEEIEVKANQFQLTRQTRDFCEGSLIAASHQESKCTTSWATAAVEVAEGALNNTVELSVEQLIQCLPVEEGVNGCEGVHPKTLTTYLQEVGLVKKADFTDCASINPVNTYHFNAVYPESPNGGGLMNLVAEGKPVFAMMALDLLRLRFVKDMRNVDESLKCGGYEPSVYGVVSGYKYDVKKIQNSFWELTSHLVGCERIIVRVPMSGNMTTANYGGIAAYAFALESVGELPAISTEKPTEAPSTSYTCSETLYPTIDDIPADATELIFLANSYPAVLTLDLSRFTQLQTLIVQNYAFANCYYVYVNNPLLTTISIGDYCFTGVAPQTGRRLSGLPAAFVIANGSSLTSISVGTGSMTNMEEVVMIEVNISVVISVGESSLSSVVSVEVNVYSVGSNLVEAITSVNVNQSIVVVTTTTTPTESATQQPSEVVTEVPTRVTTVAPTEMVTEAPTQAPVMTDVPIQIPTQAPVVTEVPTVVPTQAPTETPAEPTTVTPIITDSPLTEEPTEQSTTIPTQTVMTSQPTDAPTKPVETIPPTVPVTIQPTEIPTVSVPTEQPTEPIPSTSIPTEPSIVTEKPSEVVPTITATPTPTPEPWFPIYDPFILGDNTNYEVQETCYDEIISDMEVLDLYLQIRDAYPSKALKHTRVLALSGMTVPAVTKFHQSLSYQVMNPAPIDMYFYSDYKIKRYVDITLAIPLISLSQFTRPSRVVFADGTFKREGMDAVIQWMVDNRDKGYFVNLEFFLITGHKAASFEEGHDETYAADLEARIVANLHTICTDKTNFPKLTTMNFHNNAYHEYDNGFDASLRNACKKSETGITIQAREVTVLFSPICNTEAVDNYWYYDMTNEKEVAQCRYTWNWEYLVNPKYTTVGPFPNDYTPECV